MRTITRNFLTILMLVGSPLFLLSQNKSITVAIYQGLEENRGLPNVEVSSEGASDGFTDVEGEYELRWVNKSPGDEVKIRVRMRGFDVINKTALETLIPNSASRKVNLYLCKTGTCDDQREKYYAKAANLKLEDKFNSLERKIRREYANSSKLRSKLEALDRQKSEAERQIASLAERLAQMNLSANPKELNQAISLYQEGDVDGALEVLNPDTIVTRINQRVDSVRKYHEYNEIDSKSLLRAAEMAITDGQFGRAETYLVRASESNAKDFKSMEALCQFLVDQNDQDTLKLKQYTKALLSRALTKEEQATALQFRGIFWLAKRDYPKSIQALDKALAIRNELITSDTSGNNSSLVNKARVAETLTVIGTSYTTQKEYSQSLQKHNEALSIQKELVSFNPSLYSSDLAETYNYLGVIYADTDKEDEAISKYEKALKLNREMYQADSTSQKVRLNLSFALSNLSESYRNRKRAKSDERAYKTAMEALNIRRQLAEENPLRYGLNLIWSLKSMGRLYRDNDQHVEGIAAFQDAVNESLALQKIRPVQFDSDVAINYFLLADYFYKQKRYGDADTSYRKSAEVYKKLTEVEPSSYKASAATALFNVGICSYKLKRYKEAMTAFEESLAYREELASENPTKYNKEVDKAQKQLAKATKEWEKQPEEEREMATRSLSEETSSLEETLANKLREVGEIYLQMKNDTKALETLQEVQKTYQSMAEDGTDKYAAVLAEINSQLVEIQARLQ